MSKGLTFEILQRLLQENLLPVQFTALCNAYGIEISNATISRAIKNGHFNNHETSEMLRPLILKLDDLVERARPFPVAFENSEHIKTLLDSIEVGLALSANTIPLYKNNSNDSSTTIPAAQ
jgi:hypothetical protein